MQELTLESWLEGEQRNYGLAADLALLVAGVAKVSRDISRQVECGALAGVLGLHGTENVQGEEQKELDVISNEMMLKAVFDVKFFSYTNFPTLRRAFPHISASLPSGLKTRMRKSALSDGQISIIPSLPTPKRRSERKLAQFSGSSILCVICST